MQLPKHKWPIDENGNRYEVDHIIPLSDGGTNQASNLRLVTPKDNRNNPQTVKKYKISNKTKTKHFRKSVDVFSLSGELLMSFESQKKAADSLGCSVQLICWGCNNGIGKILNKFYIKKSNY